MGCCQASWGLSQPHPSLWCPAPARGPAPSRARPGACCLLNTTPPPPQLAQHDPREQGPSARPFPHPQSHGPSSAHPQRSASLFHFCKLGVGAIDRTEEGCCPLNLRFRKFLAPPSSIGETQGVFLSSPTSPHHWSKDQCGEGLLRTHTHTHPFPPPNPLPPQEERLGEEGEAGVRGCGCRRARARHQTEEPEDRSGQAALI